MEKIYDINLVTNNNNQMVIVVKYINDFKIETRIEPFSEELLLKYKKQYEKEKAYENKIRKRINKKINADNIDINTNFFIQNIITGGAIVLELVAIGVAAYIGAKNFIGILDDFKSMESPIIPDEEIEYSIEMHK